MRSFVARARGLRPAVLSAAALVLALATPARADDAAADVDIDDVPQQARRLVERAEEAKRPLEAAALYERAGALSLEAFRSACETPARASGAPRASHPWKCEELAFGAGRAFASAHLRGKALAAYRSLVAYGELVGAGALAQRAMREIALSYQAMTLYETAAEWHERFATRHPNAEGAPESMTDAVALSIGLGDLDRAAKDVDLYLKTWGTSRSKEAAAVVLALAQTHAEHGATDKARAVLAAHIALLDRGPLDLRVRAHALAAKVGPPSKAAAEHAVVLDLWSDPHRGEQHLRLLWSEEEEARVDRRLARVLVAVGDARIAEADAKRAADVDRLRIPAFARASDAKGVESFAREAAMPWFLAKRAAIEAVEPLYVKVLELEPVPPPVAVVVSAAAVAKMWASLGEELSSGPPGATWRGDPKLRRVYRDAVAPLVAIAIRDHAKPAMKKCVDLAVKFQVPDSPARECAAWLVAHEPDRWHGVDELVPTLRARVTADALPPMPGPPLSP